MHESIYDQVEGLLFLASGGDESQFATSRKGYRNEDIVLVGAVDEYSNPYAVKGITSLGIRVKMKLHEVVN